MVTGLFCPSAHIADTASNNSEYSMAAVRVRVDIQSSSTEQSPSETVRYLYQIHAYLSRARRPYALRCAGSHPARRSIGEGTRPSPRASGGAGYLPAETECLLG